MQLKQLEMCGFKSFANKTTVNFEPGVTLVVGPNGSGKSNVVDAIKWVLGTLSYKSVRGDEMMDVVFKGGGGLGPAGFAEVSLTLDNTDKSLPLEFEEVVITRRLHRDGVGEYLINGSASRLKDIRDLLYGTGIGTDNYSIIEQGKIDRLVTTDARGRRLVFDEAAGISKYRAKKRECEQRLEKVGGDMERLGMLLGEVRSQLRSVRGQASRAVRYKEMKDAYIERRTKLIGHEYRQLAARATELTRKIAAMDTEQKSRLDEIEKAKGEVAAIAETLSALDCRGNEISGALSAASSRADYLTSTIQQSEARLGELSQSRARAEKERADAAARMQEGEQLLGKIRTECADMERTLDALCTRLTDTQARLDESSREVRRTRSEQEGKKAEGIELAAKESGYRSDLNKCAADMEGLVHRRERTIQRVAASEREMDDTLARLGELSARKRELEAALEDLKRRITVEEEEQKRRVEERTRLDEELVRLRASRDKTESRRETLRELELAYDGLGSGARELLKSGFAGVRGTVVDCLEANIEHVSMIEAALGENAGAVVIDTLDQARTALAFVREKGLDRTSVVALEACMPRLRRDALVMDGVVVRASELVRCEEAFKPLVESLLGEVIFVDGEDEADALRDYWSVRGTLVTRAGDVYDGRGIMTAGARKAGLLARKVDLRKLAAELDGFTGLIDEKEARKRDLDAEIKAGEERAKSMRHEVYDKSVALTEDKSLQEQLEKRCAFLSGEIDNSRAELLQMESEEKALAERKSRLEGLLVDLASLKEQILKEVAVIGEMMFCYEEGRAQIQVELTQASTERAQAQEKVRSLQQQVEGVTSENERQREIVRRNEEHVAEIEARCASVRQEIEGYRTQQAELAITVERYRTTLASLETERAEIQSKVDVINGRIGELDKANVIASSQIGELKITEAREQVERENLVQRAREEFGLDVTQQPEVEQALDWTPLSNEANELQVKIANFGTVNVVALEQLKELETREGDLIAQQDDISRAKRELEGLIRRLNMECRIKFEKTFEFVREEFNNIFRKVFGGGKADIILEQVEGGDPMEQGLEIMARPPSKDQLPISLLSGGEKTLTAFSLVMALFKANPSPFCVLDEADAALDEKNVDRYAGVINEFVNDTQFIVISHNKRTMATGDVLYGVTMQTPGVSTLVNVDLHGGDNLALLKERRERIRSAREASAAQRSAEIAELKLAADQALAEATNAEAGAEVVESASTATAVADPPPVEPKVAKADESERNPQAENYSQQ